MDLFDPSIEQLVSEIIAVNYAWKKAQDLFDCADNHSANSLRDLKARLQLTVLKQKLSPNKAQTRFISNEYITILVEP